MKAVGTSCLDMAPRAAPIGTFEKECLLEIVKDHIEIIDDKSSGLGKAEKSTVLARHCKYLFFLKQAVGKLPSRLERSGNPFENRKLYYDS